MKNAKTPTGGILRDERSLHMRPLISDREWTVISREWIPRDDITRAPESSWCRDKQTATSSDGLPSEKAVIVWHAHDLLLKTIEGLVALAVEEGHVDPKDTHERICAAFFSCCDSVSCPRHSLCDARRL